MPSLRSENFVITVHTIETKSTPKKLIADNKLIELQAVIEEFLKENNSNLNGIAVEVERVESDD